MDLNRYSERLRGSLPKGAIQFIVVFPDDGDDFCQSIRPKFVRQPIGLQPQST
jgi:hypothetical protein